MALPSQFGSSKRFWLAGLILASALGLAGSAGATMLTLGLTVEFSGGQAPAGATPWVTATFDDALDIGGANSVRLTMTAGNLTGSGNNGEFISEMIFNFASALNPTLLSFTDVSSPTVGTTTVATGVNAFMADGDGSFDIRFSFPTTGMGGGAQRFTDNEVVVYDITYTSPINANSFNFFSATGGGQGIYLSAAHVQNTSGAGSGGSGWIGAVPEPSTALLFGAGLMGLAAIGRRSR